MRNTYMSRKPVYKKCIIYPTMECNPNVCKNYNKCRINKCVHMLEMIKHIVKQLTAIDIMMRGFNEDNI